MSKQEEEPIEWVLPLGETTQLGAEPFTNVQSFKGEPLSRQ
jgi:hypothetical protein